MSNRPICRTLMSHHGYTLIELLISSTIITIILGMSIPTVSQFVQRQHIKTSSNALLESLYLARNYAIYEQTVVHLCQLDVAGATTCSGNQDRNRDWSKGWLVFVDTNGNDRLDAEQELIRHVSGSEHINLVFNQRGKLRFGPDGSARSAGFTVCDGTQTYYRHIYLLHTGRARISDRTSAAQRGKCDSMNER